MRASVGRGQRWLARIGLTGWIAALAVVLHAGHGLADGRLALPRDAAAWTDAVTFGDPITLAMGIARLGLLGAGWYLLGSTVLAVAGAVWKQGIRGVPVDRLAVRPLRQVARVAVGAALVGAMTAGSTGPAGASPLAPAGFQIVGHDEVRGQVVGSQDAPAGSVDAPPDRRPTAGTETAGGAPDPVGVHGADADAHAATDAAESDGDARVHVVAAGDSFWKIAASEIAAAGGPAPAPGHVVDYWRELIDENLDRLVVADDPDLIVPGQRLVVPAVAEASAPSDDAS